MESSTRKIVFLCHDEFAFIREHGRFQNAAELPSPSGSLLWSIVSLMQRFLYAETQAIEGLNSLVKLIGKRCPNISLELLSSRLSLKKQLGLVDGGRQKASSRRWSAMQGSTQAMVRELVEYKTACLSVLCNSSRWAHAEPVQLADATPSDPKTFPLTDLDQQVVLVQTPADIASHAAASSGASSSSQSMVLPRQASSLVPAQPAGGIACSFSDCFRAASSAVTAEAILWAKSYNLGWKRRTWGGWSKKRPQGLVLSLRGAGFGLAVLKPSNLHQPMFFLAVDRFSSSVSFAPLQVTPDGRLVFEAGQSRAIESIQLLGCFETASSA